MKMKQIRVVHGYGKMSDAELVAHANTVHTGLAGNSNFPNPPVDLATCKAAIESYSAAITEAFDGSKIALAKRNNLRAAVVSTLRLLGRYVEFHCKNDMEIFSGTGFSAASTTTAAPQPLDKPGSP